MVYLLYGSNLTKLNYYLDKIKLENEDSEKNTIDSEFDIDSIWQNFYTPPMLSNKRLVILPRAFNFAKIDFAKIHPQVDVVIIQAGKFRPTLPKFNNLVVIEAKKDPLIFRFLDDLVGESAKINLLRLFQILKIEDFAFVFYQFISHFRRLILLKTGYLPENLASWQVEKYRKIAGKTSLNQLKTAYRLLLATEILAKTGQQELSTALPILVLKLTRTFQNL